MLFPFFLETNGPNFGPIFPRFFHAIFFPPKLIFFYFNLFLILGGLLVLGPKTGMRKYKKKPKFGEF